MSNLIYLTDHELAVVLANLKASPLPTQAGPVWRKIVRQVGHGELVGGEYDPEQNEAWVGWPHTRTEYDPNAQAESCICGETAAGGNHHAQICPANRRK